jgi:hypothetical protein
LPYFGTLGGGAGTVVVTTCGGGIGRGLLLSTAE